MDSTLIWQVRTVTLSVVLFNGLNGPMAYEVWPSLRLHFDPLVHPAIYRLFQAGICLGPFWDTRFFSFRIQRQVIGCSYQDVDFLLGLDSQLH